MSWQTALIVGCLIVAAMGIGAALPRREKDLKNKVIRPEVGGVWKMNHDWNVRTRK